MHAILQDYLNRLEELHEEIFVCLDGLSPEALDWTPLQKTSGDMNSISILVTHICGAERYWIGDIALGEPSDRVRSSEFETKKLAANDLGKKIEAATDYARYVLEQLDFNSLDIKKTRLRDGREVTVGWALLHALEHTAIHLGHIQITRQLWEEKQ